MARMTTWLKHFIELRDRFMTAKCTPAVLSWNWDWGGFFWRARLIGSVPPPTSSSTTSFWQIVKLLIAKFSLSVPCHRNIRICHPRSQHSKKFITDHPWFGDGVPSFFTINFDTVILVENISSKGILQLQSLTNYLISKNFVK